MEFHDIVLDGKPLRIWNRQGTGQVAPQQRQPLHLYDAEQWVQRVQHQAPEHLTDVQLAGLQAAHRRMPSSIPCIVVS
ncbi:MAG: hypothetical protein R3F47_18660 [Gammaproteobacteria bacterium]